MTRPNHGMPFVAVFACFVSLGTWATPSPGWQDSQAPIAQPDAGARDVLQARVAEVHGSVKKAPVGTRATDAGWTPVKLDEMLPSGTQIKTGFRSSVVLEFGTDTVVQIRKASLASIDDYYKTATEKSVLLGLGYGVIRGGSTEAELRTDMVVDSTVATLAKRGTEGWQLEVDPSTGRFRVSLSRSGLLEALAKASRQRRTVRANEYVSDRTIKLMWVNQDVFDRKVAFYEDASVSPSESKFSAENPGGTTVVSPDASEANEITKRIDPNFVSTFVATQQQQAAGQQLLLNPVLSLLRRRPEGDFGIPPTLGGLVGLTLGQQAAAKGRLETRRFSRPPRFSGRRSATRVLYKR